MTGLLVRGNRKLGESIWHFSMPAVHTCPGRSKSCEKLCYATSGFYNMANVKKTLVDREKERHKADFVDRVVTEIKERDMQTVRIHVSGDFDSLAYIRKWDRIIQQCPKTRFYFYTRSWRVTKLRDSVIKLTRHANVAAWFSCDKDTGKPPYVRNIGRAYMALDNADKPSYTVDLVFRVTRPDKIVRWHEHAAVCPVERDLPSKIDHDKINCETCRLCFGESKLQWLRNFKNGVTISGT